MSVSTSSSSTDADVSMDPAAAAAATSSNPSNNNNGNGNSDGTEVASMKKLLLDTKIGHDKKSLWQTTLETFGMADGKHEKTDIHVSTVEEGLELLKEYVAQRTVVEKQKASAEAAAAAATATTTTTAGDSQKKKKGKTTTTTPCHKFCLELAPLAEFNATPEEFLTAFLKWAEKDTPVLKKTTSTTSTTTTASGTTASGTSTIKSPTTTTQINVSKARRRLDAYFEWMSENYHDLEEPLTVQSIRPAAKIWDIQISYDDNDETKGHFVWWVDLGPLNKHDLMKQLTPRDHLRYVVWFSHVVMLDKHAQNTGAMIIEDMGHMGFFQMASLVPAELGAKMDRLTIGILPVKMKAIYIFGAARWMSLLMTLMKPFMSQKMRDRMILVSDKTDMQTFCDDLVGRKNIPVNFCRIQGEAPRDAVLDRIASVVAVATSTDATTTTTTAAAEQEYSA